MKGIKGWFIRFAVNYSLSHTQDNYLMKLLQPLVLDKIRSQIGLERLDFLISGGSLLASDSIVYLRKVLNCGFYQGYGSSETFGGVAISTKYAKDTSGTGAIGVTTEFKLRNLPDLEYTYKSNRCGELLLRGPQVFSKYFKDDEATKAAVDKDGWFSTGDIVHVDKGGKISIVDRIKNIFKLAQGEYIAAEKIENLYISNNSIVSQIFVYGDSLSYFLVGIVGIEELDLLELLKSSDFSNITTSEQLLNVLDDLKFRKFILGYLNKNIQNSELHSFEKIKNVYLAIDPFKVAEGTITPTLKLMRNNARKRFQTEINSMYKEGII